MFCCLIINLVKRPSENECKQERERVREGERELKLDVLISINHSISSIVCLLSTMVDLDECHDVVAMTFVTS